MATKTRPYNILIHAQECSGCMSCALKCSFLYHKEFNPARSWIQVYRDGSDMAVYLTEECTYCGACARACAYGALELERRG